MVYIITFLTYRRLFMEKHVLFSLTLLTVLITFSLQSMDHATSNSDQFSQFSPPYVSAMGSFSRQSLSTSNAVNNTPSATKQPAPQTMAATPEETAAPRPYASVNLVSEANTGIPRALDAQTQSKSISEQQSGEKNNAEGSLSGLPGYGSLRDLQNDLLPYVATPEPTSVPAPSTASTASAAQASGSKVSNEPGSTTLPAPTMAAGASTAQEQCPQAKKEKDKSTPKSNNDNALYVHALKNFPERLEQAINAFQRGMDFKSYKRLLLVGPSGAGKSTIAQAIAHKCGIPLLFHRASFIANTYQNGGEQNLKAIFEEAFTKQPCILVIDELNTLFEKHGRAQDNDQGMLRALWSMIDASENHRVIFIGTCNYLKDLPREIATRFPGIIKIELPNEQARIEALDFHIRQQRRTNYIKFDAIDSKKIAQKTDGFSLREIANLIDLASLIGDDANNNTKNKKLGFVNTEDVLQCIPEILKQRYEAIDKTTDEWKEYAKIALHYGFQVATYAGQMAFQKYMQDRQIKHANELHADAKAHAENQSSAANTAKNAAITAGVGAIVGGAATYIMNNAPTKCTIQ